MNNSKNRVITYERFFSKGAPQPINRIAYSKEDALYKLECIKAMLEIDDRIQITIDKIGNICATLPAKNHLVNSKHIVAGSHTDSVRDGGQFDGCLGVYSAMKTLEDITTLEKDANQKDYKKLNMYADYKVVIFACEESTRFNMACIGSSYISKSDDKDKSAKYLESLMAKKDCLKESDAEPNQGTLGQALIVYRQYLEDGFKELNLDRKRITFVDKVLSSDEIDQLFECHIEQSQQLAKEQIRRSALYGKDPSATDFTMAPDKSIDLSQTDTILGAVTAIGKPIRGSIVVNSTPDNNPIVTAANLIKHAQELGNNSSNDSIRTSVPQFDSADKNGKYKTLKSDDNHHYLKIVCTGESNHSGGTPMSERRDSNVAMSELLTHLDQNIKTFPSMYPLEILSVQTPIYGMNQIQDNTVLYLSRSDTRSLDWLQRTMIFSTIIPALESIYHVKFEVGEESEEFKVPASDPIVQLQIDMRQNGEATIETTMDKFQKEVIDATYMDCQIQKKDKPDLIEFTETSKGNPIQTSKDLCDDFLAVCNRMGVNCINMQSFPGHDCAVALTPTATGKRFLIFVPSIHGSHNPEEQTWEEAVNVGTSAFSNLVIYRAKCLGRQAYNHVVMSRFKPSQVKDVKDEKEESTEKVYEFGSGEKISPDEEKKNFLAGKYENKIPELNAKEKNELLEQLSGDEPIL